MGGGSVTVVYIDLLFLLNLAANYLLLLGAGRLAGAGREDTEGSAPPCGTIIRVYKQWTPLSGVSM